MYSRGVEEAAVQMKDERDRLMAQDKMENLFKKAVSTSTFAATGGQYWGGEPGCTPDGKRKRDDDPEDLANFREGGEADSGDGHQECVEAEGRFLH